MKAVKTIPILIASIVSAGMVSAGPAWANHSFHAPGKSTWGEPSAITCETVRAYVSQVGFVAARAAALAYGMTPSQERRARHCLAKRD
jgi:hypothetical protein